MLHRSSYTVFLRFEGFEVVAVLTTRLDTNSRQTIYATIRQLCFVVDPLTIERTNLNLNNIPEVEFNEFESC